MTASVFKTNRSHFIYESTNEILLRSGLQKGPELVWKALCALKKVTRFEDPPFPLELEDHRWWMEQLTGAEANSVISYSERAASLAYRYLRKKRNGS